MAISVNIRSVKKIVDLKEVPIWLAARTGVIRRAETSITPSSFTPAINAIAVPINKKYLVRLIGILSTRERSGCIVDITRGRHWEIKIMQVITKNPESMYKSTH